MRVVSLHRYPVKSMLGEDVDSVVVDERGVVGDRRLALIDSLTGRVASAKQPRLWRDLLQCRASGDPGAVRIRLPDGVCVAAEAPETDDLLSRVVRRPVRMVSTRLARGRLERPDPECVLELGVDAEVDARVLEIAQATPGDSFTDLAPLHAITTATVERIGVEALRYRPNLVIATPPGFPPYAENNWTGKELTVGEARLRALKPTSRCAVPTLEHGALPAARTRCAYPGREPGRHGFWASALRRSVFHGTDPRPHPHR